MRKKIQGDGKGGARKNSLSIPGDAMILRSAKLRTDDPAEFLTGIMSDDRVDIRLRVDSAVKLLGLAKKKIRRDGQREDAQQAAESAVSSGRFAPNKAPKLRIVK